MKQLILETVKPLKNVIKKVQKSPSFSGRVLVTSYLVIIQSEEVCADFVKAVLDKIDTIQESSEKEVAVSNFLTSWQ